MPSIPIRMLNEIQYCERLYHIMHVQGIFEESADTVEGAAQHKRAERRRRSNNMTPEELWDAAPRSLHLGSEELGIVGKLDAIEYVDGLWTPVEGKHSASPDGGHVFHVKDYELSAEAWPNDQIQLCAQGLLLRENGFASDYGYIYYRGNRKKVRINFTESLIQLTNELIARAKILESESIPTPLSDSNKCFRCSLNYVCLPDETNYLMGSTDKIRTIVPGRSDGGVLYVSEPGAKLSKSGESVVIYFPDGRVDDIPIKDLVHVTIMGNVQYSTQLAQTLMTNQISISHLTSHGTLIGITSPLATKNVKVRQQQFIKFQHAEISLQLARWVIFSKISNQRTLLRRNGEPTKQILQELKDLRDHSLEAKSKESLLGIEGRSARIYMESFPTMLKVREWDGEAIMLGRNRRPPKDPVNALLSFGYSLLTREMIAACGNVGLDPLFGFYHSIEPGRPALSLDLMEPFRSLIVDSIVIRVLNTQEIQKSDFYIGPDSVSLKKGARNTFFGAYERRLHETLSHPVFGYKLSYRRLLDMEVRLLARFLEGELPEYRPVVTR